MASDTGMTTFSVTIESAEGKPLRLLVTADNWVAAWQEGLRVIGIDELPADAQCVVRDAGRVDIQVATLRRHFVVQQVTELPTGARPRAGQPLLLAKSEVGDAAIQVRHATRNPKLFRRPQMAEAIVPSPHGSAQLTATVPANDRVAAGPESAATLSVPQSAATPDPIARILSDLERQRLAARPVRISSQTGLPSSPASGRPRREVTPTTVPRLAPTTDERKRPRDETRAFASAAAEGLPQEFHPVQAEQQAPGSLDLALQWATETAWQHVPCALVLALTCDEGPWAEVAAARGTRERESRGCLLASDRGPTQLGRAPSRARFPTGRVVSFQRRDGSSWELAVESVMSVPIVLADGAFAGLALLLLNATRQSGFTDSELRAVTYLAHTLASRL